MKLMIGILIVVVAFGVGSASPSFRGIAPQDEHLYNKDFIKCKDGSNKFTMAHLNDNFCDCPDGTDEPGTSACPYGRFYCHNAGHSPKLIFSSRVDDGICDCCDGSDESSFQCPDTCWQAGKASRDKLRTKISTFHQGVSLRNLLIQQAKAALAKDRAELDNLKAQEKTLKALFDHLKAQKQQIDEEEKEKRRLLKEHQDSQNKKDDEAHKIGTLDQQQPVEHIHGDSESVDAQKPPNENEDTTRGNDASENSEELSREELGRLVASRWTGENTGKQTEDVNTAEDDNHVDTEDFEETIKDLDDHEHDAYASETDDDHQRYDDNVNAEDEADDHFREEDPLDSPSSYKYDSDTESEFADTANPSNPSLLEKIQQKLRNILKSVSLFQTPVNQSDAARIRKEYDESTGKLSKIQSRISSLTQKLKHDFGPDKEFYSFYDKCFESKESKYVYKVCPFKHASQEEGHSSTRLGRWDKFDDSYKVMIFSNGDKCWNGPDRSLTVKLRCGLKNEFADVDEPSRCEYVALLSTPALCFEEKLKELQHKLDEMNKDQPEKHDEL